MNTSQAGKLNSAAIDEPVSIEHDYETRYWARTMHCTETELREAVRAVGNDVEDLRRHLGPRNSTPNH